jgi:hypothetical protein
MKYIYETFTNQKQWKEYLQNLLVKNQNALYKAILVIYDRQTPDEKESYVSVHDNNKGFSKVDCEFLTGIAKKILHGQPLTKDEYYKARNKMKKYWKQLMIVSKQKMARKVDEESPNYIIDYDGQLMFRV